jgi:dihydroorotase
MMSARILYENARIVDPSRNMDETGDIVVIDGRIAACGASAANQGAPDGAMPCAIARPDRHRPGLVDAASSSANRAREHRETIASASAAAAGAA